MNYSFITVFTCNIIIFVVSTAITWTSPENIKLANGTSNPFGRDLTDTETSWISSLLSLGAIVGPLFAATLADVVGRKPVILSLAFPSCISYVILASSNVVWLFYFARFLMGLVVGAAFTILPMYIGEVAEDTHRGFLSSSLNIFICFGLLFSYMLGPYVSITCFNAVLAVFPVVFFVLFLIFGVESVHYLVAKNDHTRAKACLQKLRNTSKDQLENELHEIEMAVKSSGKGTVLDIFKSRGLVKALIISLGLVAFQQLCGINAVLMNAQNIFKQADVALSPEICSMLIGATQFVTSFITPLVMNTFGRKTLLLFSAIGIVLSETAVGVYFYLSDKGDNVDSIGWLPIAALIIYILTYNCGFGPLPWTVVAEVFPSNVRAPAGALTASFCWFLGFVVTQSFQSVQTGIGLGPSFWMYAGFSGIAAVFIASYVIETKGKSLKEIQDTLNG